jgi:hypothetical protein
LTDICCPSNRPQDRGQLYLYLRGRFCGAGLQQAILHGAAMPEWGLL